MRAKPRWLIGMLAFGCQHKSSVYEPSPVDADGGVFAHCTLPCGGSCCLAGQLCVADLCAPDFGPCRDADDCSSDSACRDGHCVPWGVPPESTHDDSCLGAVDISSLLPVEQCTWTGGAEDDPERDSNQVMSTTIVIDLDLDADAETLRPSIIFASFRAGPTNYFGPGILRVIDGTTCVDQFAFVDPDEAIMAPASPAAGDLDGDGRADIVAAAQNGGLLAWKYDPSTREFARLWRSALCDPNGRTPDDTGGKDKWSGPSIHDLDDDGKPEILYGGVVYDQLACLLSDSLGFPHYSKGLVPVIADVDEDGAPELIMGNGVFGWDEAAHDWVLEPYFNGSSTSTSGQVAVADLGNFPIAALGGIDGAEIVVVANGLVRIQTIDGQVVFGPYAIPGGGVGGPPTIADFDGDGRREFAVAGGGAYAVFDLDCVAGGDPQYCNDAVRTDGISWSQPSQDSSSNVTGSSVFDFDADGAAEVVYADECYLRIYDGRTGAVRTSFPRSSGTTYENPVIVDVDGDFHTEIVAGLNDYAGTQGCPDSDPLNAAAHFTKSHGVVVLRDETDRWAASRPVWNQHAYAVTHVGDHGEIPRSSEVAINWRDPTLNNFRQNVQGKLEARGVPDLTTAVGGDFENSTVTLDCQAGMGTLRLWVCNRGALPVGDGTVVSVRAGSAAGDEICRTTAGRAIDVGQCAEAQCTGQFPDRPVDLYIVADPDGALNECHEGNNLSLLRGSGCPVIE